MEAGVVIQSEVVLQPHLWVVTAVFQQFVLGLSTRHMQHQIVVGGIIGDKRKNKKRRRAIVADGAPSPFWLAQATNTCEYRRVVSQQHYGKNTS